jgi:hypothetical protein
MMGAPSPEDGPLPRRLAALVTAALLTLPAGLALAATGDPLRPNLQPLPASDVRLATTADGRTLLRFSTTSRNVGLGALELRAGDGDAATGRQRVYQRVFLEGGGAQDQPVGDFVYHPEHDHIHFEGYALYELQPVDAPGGSLRTGSKVTFCVMDTTRIDTRLPGAPKKAVYTVCGSQVQGMSVGWGDKYGYHLAGQEIDVTGLPDGVYALRITVDPQNRLAETSDADNVSSVDVRLAGGTVTVLGAKPGRG